MTSDATRLFREARDVLLRADGYAAARAAFRWPALTEFNWALDWFDVIAAGNDTPALTVVEADGTARTLTFAQLAVRSNQVANWLRARGARRGDRLILMLGNTIELWETMLAAIKLGVVVIPASTLLGPADLADRVARGRARHVVVGTAQAAAFNGLAGEFTRTVVDPTPPATNPAAATDVPDGLVGDWVSYAETASAATTFEPDGPTRADDPMLLYFTSGTTASPKLVEHTHVSYPVGHLTTMYWIGLRPGDVHLNVSSPGWAKHAWSNLFAPWNAEATVFLYNYARFDAPAMLDVMTRHGVTTFCAPPTVWRMLIQADLAAHRPPLRAACGAGEPLNPEVIEQVRAAWGITVRDGFGQTETTLAVGNPPGEPLKLGSMGRPMPGYPIALIDPVSGEPAPVGEICVDLAERPLALMAGYRDDAARAAEAMRGGYYHTGDIASIDDDGYLTYVGRSDDVFKASDYRISPFELESVLIEHPAVAEAAVVPAPDPLRLAVPKAYVVLAEGHPPDADTALAILRHARANLAPYKRVRRLEFTDLPKTISGKIRRVELRALETASDGRRPEEFREEDFPDLKG
jgi:acetyl-CoA synthetase